MGLLKETAWRQHAIAQPESPEGFVILRSSFPTSGNTPHGDTLSDHPGYFV